MVNLDSLARIKRMNETIRIINPSINEVRLYDNMVRTATRKIAILLRSSIMVSFIYGVMDKVDRYYLGCILSDSGL